MPQVKGGNKKQGGRQSGGSGRGKSSGSRTSGGRASNTPARDAVAKQSADVGSIFMGVFFLGAILIGAAAWMGNSISVVEDKANEIADGVAKTFGFSVQTIHVVDDVNPDQERRILDALGVVQGDNMFRADPHQLKERLDELPGFGGIQVHRFWPNQITVVATPLEASVLYRNDQTGDVVPVHMTGEIADEVSQTALYHTIQGEGALEAYPVLHSELQDFPTIDTRLDYAERRGERRWDLVMVSGTRVKLPSGDARSEALAVLAALQRETGVLDRQVEMIDLRDPARVYVRRRQLEAGLAGVERAG